MRVRDVVLVILALLVLAVGGALWWLYASRDVLIKRAIERFGPELTGVSVKVASVRLEPLDGRGAINGLEVGNPKGCEAPHALSLEAPSIVYERGPGGDNLTAIQKHVESSLAKSEPAKGDSKAEKKAKERRFIIDRVQVRKAKVSYGGRLAVDVPDLVLRDLGKKTGGATAAQITQEVWTAVTRQALAGAPASIRGLEERTKDAVDRLKGLLK